MLLGKKKKSKNGEPCPPFAWLDDEVDQAISAGIEAGICTTGELTANVCGFVYPKTPDGRTVAWPKTTPWVPPAEENESVQCIWDEVSDRVMERLESLPEGACGPPLQPSDVIKPYLAKPGKPRPGTFYQIRKGDNLSKLVRSAMNLGPGHKLAAPSLRCTTSSQWNLTYYGTPWDPDNKLFPRYTATDTEEGLMVISKAFLPRHQNALSEMYSGRLPERAIDDSMAGRPLGLQGANSYGLLWFPVMRIIDGQLACPDGTWPDGRSKTEPPPEVLKMLS
jgi:hypothetical protein